MAIESDVLTEKERRDRLRATYWSFSVGIVLMILKFWAHNLTDSQAIFSDAVESIVNVVAAAVGIWVIWYSSKPADEDHPYGHGKIEYFSSAFEGGLITFASLMIVVEAVHSFARGESVHSLDVGLVLISGAALVNMLLGFYLKERGRRLGSVALVASGQHVLSDFWTSAGVVGGLLLAKLTGWVWLDPAMALAVGLLLGWSGFNLMRESISGLMDKEDPKLLESLVQVFSECFLPGIIQIHHVRVIRSGWYHHIDAHVVLPQFWEVDHVHKVMNEFEKKVIRQYAFGGEMNFHVDPCRRAYCKHCTLGNCSIREEAFQAPLQVRLDDIRSPVEPSEFKSRRRH